MNGDTAALAEARRRRAAMEAALRELEHAVAGPLKSPTWRSDVAAAVEHLSTALEEHIAAVEGAGGLLGEVESQAPRLGPSVDLMRDEHRSLRKGLGELASLIESHRDDDGPVREQIRETATEVITALELHRQRGSDLVYDAYQVDIGGGA